ncbi:MAG: hypothetical protein QNK22_08860 [Xanthomonadales bacterium]|nr:hypothetical protein [Xanthomonadales bacterium]
MRSFKLILLGIILTATAINLPAFEPDSSDKDQLAAAKAIIDIKAADAGIQKFFDDSAGYAVLPSRLAPLPMPITTKVLPFSQTRAEVSCTKPPLAGRSLNTPALNKVNFQDGLR